MVRSFSETAHAIDQEQGGAGITGHRRQDVFRVVSATGNAKTGYGSWEDGGRAGSGGRSRGSRAERIEIGMVQFVTERACPYDVEAA
jgi:hypothetical protein